MNRCFKICAGLFLILALNVTAADWPMAAGPNQNFIVSGTAASHFSVSLNENIQWRTPLPNTGQSSPIISGDCVFVTSHASISEDTEMGSTIYGMCFDAKTGKERWRRELPATRNTDLSSLFNDNTAAAPVADGTHVCFVNVGGSIKCFDYAGKEQWSYEWVPFGRHHARKHQPILHQGQLIVMQVPRQDLDPKVTTKAGSKPLGRDKAYWTQLMSFDLKTGKINWTADCGTSVHAISMIGKTSQGLDAILTGRGGGHQPPEEPYGLSLVNASDGSTIWDLPIKGYAAAQVINWTPMTAYFFAGEKHGTVDIASGKRQKESSLIQDVHVTAMGEVEYKTRPKQTLEKSKKPTTYYTNIIVGDYHYFRAHKPFLIGRIHLQTEQVEYLQVPVQVTRSPKGNDTLWTKALPNDMKNADGFRATQDKRNAGNGWGHVSAATPIVVGDFLYMPTMIGMVYVIKWNAEQLDEHALVFIGDLGLAGETWSLAGLSYADGRLYARTLKELICIGER